MMTANELMAFETKVKLEFEAGHILGPVHLAGGNEAQLITIFKDIGSEDWIFASYRNHYHALLHGIPQERVMYEIMSGRSMNLSFPEYRFFTSAIVGGCLPIAVGVAAALKRQGSKRRVWCFVGDMAATTGAFHEAITYADKQGLPIEFVVEDNGFSCESPTLDCWGKEYGDAKQHYYLYNRVYPHVGTGKYVAFV